MQRGDIWICRFEDEQKKTRPVAILTRNELCEVRKNVTVAVATHTIRNIPTEIPVGSEEGLSSSGVINVGDIYTIPKRYLLRNTGQLSAEKLTLLRKAINFALGLD